jgi:hypothetical protein
MKPLFSAVLASALAISLHAQAPAAGGPGTGYTPDQLDSLVAPIALYPDPLVALVLPASTVPSDVALAAQFLAAGGSPSAIDSQPWDPSVRGLAHYPEVLKWMNDNADWTSSLGAAFAMQPADVMKSVQQMRAKARAAGTLADTPQQQVDMEGDDIRIIPAQPDEIYVPQYDPDVMYDVPEGYAGPFMTFGPGYPAGIWLGYECNWDDFGVWVGPWRSGWGYRRDWNDSRSGGGRWHPDPRRGHDLVRDHFRPGGNLPAPRPFAGARSPSRGVNPGIRPSVVQAQSRPDYRGYGGGAIVRPSSPAPSGSVFGGYSRGTQARDNSARGHASRQAPVRSGAPAGHAAPSRSAPPSSGGKDRH